MKGDVLFNMQSKLKECKNEVAQLDEAHE